MPKPTVWILNQYAITPDLPGGTRHYDLARELLRLGYDVIILASSFHHYLHREVRLRLYERWRLEEVDGVKFVWLRTPPYWRNDWRRAWNMVVFMLQVLRFGRRLPEPISRPDVIIGSSPHLLTALAAFLLARYHRAGFIMEVRDLWPQTMVDMGQLSERSLTTALLRYLERCLYLRADKLIVLGPRMIDYIVGRGVDRARLTWIPNGVDLSRYEDTKRLMGPADGVFRVVYVGAHGQANALDILIHAAREIQERGRHDIQMILVGDGPEKPKLAALAVALGLSNVEFRDAVPKTEVPRVLSEADLAVIVVHPRFFSSGGSLNKLSDYMAAGRPIVLCGRPTGSVASSPLWPDRSPVEEAESGLVVPADPQALAEGILILCRMTPEERQRLGASGRAYVEKHHDIRVLGQRLAEVVEAAVASRARSRP